MNLTIGKKLTISTVLFSLAAIAPFLILALMAVTTARDSLSRTSWNSSYPSGRSKRPRWKTILKNGKGIWTCSRAR